MSEQERRVMDETDYRDDAVALLPPERLRLLLPATRELLREALDE